MAQKGGKFSSVARIDPSKLNSVPLPPDVMADLQDAFNFYDKDSSGIITIAHFRNILRNFGFHKLSK